MYPVCLLVQTDGSLGMVLRRGVVVWMQGGMRIRGVRTCGDLFFSGHTTTMTLMNYFISECESRYPRLIQHLSDATTNLYN